MKAGVFFQLLLAVLTGWQSLAAQNNTVEWSAGPMPSIQLKTVNFRGWIPEGDQPLNGVLVLIPGRHQDGRGMAGDAAWQEVARDVHFAILACQFADGEKYVYQCDPEGEVSKALNKAVEKLAQESQHPELGKAPLAFWGCSAGSNVSANYCTRYPHRAVAFASSTGTSGPGGEMSPGKADIPMLFAVGKKDNADWVKDSLQNIEAGRSKKAPWTLALQVNAGHGIGKSLALVYPFLKAVIHQRQGTVDGQTTAQEYLQKIDVEKGWLGNPDTYDTAVYADYAGEKRDAIWLPDEATAKAWQAYLTGQ